MTFFLFVYNPQIINKKLLDRLKKIYSNRTENQIKRVGHIYKGEKEEENGNQNHQSIGSAGAQPSLGPSDTPNKMIDRNSVYNEKKTQNDSNKA